VDSNDMTTYPAGLSKVTYLQQFSKEGVEVGNYVSSDISVGRMPSYINVESKYHIPASNSVFGSVSWTTGTHTGSPITLSTSTIPTCFLMPTVMVSFYDGGVTPWTVDTGIEVQLQRSTNGGATYTSVASQNFYFPNPATSPVYRSFGPGAALMLFTTNTNLLDVTLRLQTRAIGYNPAVATRSTVMAMRVLVFNKV